VIRYVGYEYTASLEAKLFSFFFAILN